MASQQQHHHYCQTPNPTATTTTCNCCCNHHPAPPPPPPPQQSQIPLDPLLEVLTFHLHNQPHYHHHHQPNPNTNPYSCPNNTHPTKTLFHPNNHHFNWDPQYQKDFHLIISSLFQRINKLESSLHHFSSSSNKTTPSYSPLREAAARVIQTHFRTFLARRSRTLRQLKELAFVKTSFNSLKSDVYTKTHLDFEVVSRKAMDLLLRVDSIEGGDPMMRDGKRSITRDLVRFLDYIDGFTVSRNGVESVRNMEKSRAMGDRCGRGKWCENQRENMQEFRGRVEKIHGFSRAHENDENGVELEGFRQFVGRGDDEEKSAALRTRKGVLVKGVAQPRGKKSVRFVENGNVHCIFDDACEPGFDGKFCYDDGSDLSDDNEEAVQNQFDIVEESRGHSKGGKGDDDEAESEMEGSGESSDGERIPKRVVRGSSSGSGNGSSSRYFQDQDGSLVFSAPVPGKMEPRTDLTKKRQSIKIDE